MTPAEFDAAIRTAKRPQSIYHTAARLVLVNGLRPIDVATSLHISYQSLRNAVARLRKRAKEQS